jgi:hypothetical protein
VLAMFLAAAFLLDEMKHLKLENYINDGHI